mmetsp:Transcript_11579/g.15676  ORF Transcript_11579/g.15676 Transcript_11579/m.15676 type:complete len:121 (+) Transcript_11579:638-1000(+)
MICGAFPALVLVVALAFAFLVGPLYLWERYENWRTETERVQATRQLLDGLFKRHYDANVFKSQDSCMICLVNFDEDALVTPLPCDIRHYFHTGCIEQWLVLNPSCPLCKSPVTVEEIERV